MIVEGRVQGVGFRGFVQMNAMKLNLTGTVRNMLNGMVEIFVQGEEERIMLFMKEIKKGNMFIIVEEITSKEVPVVADEKKFRALY